MPCTGGGDTTPARYRRGWWLVPPARTVEGMDIDVTPGVQGRPQLDDVIADAGQRRKQWSRIDSYSECNGFKGTRHGRGASMVSPHAFVRSDHRCARPKGVPVFMTRSWRTPGLGPQSRRMRHAPA